MKLLESQDSPYLPLFIIGTINAMTGVILWIAFSFNFFPTYPRQLHASIMFLGFLWSFVAGFFMTAVPRMTQSTPARNWEVLIAGALSVSVVVLSIINKHQYIIGIGTAQFIFLVYFLSYRFLVSKRVPFEGFIFVPFAFTCFLFGITELYKGHLDNFFLFTGEAFILNLICGIGSRLIPVICRVPEAILPDQLTTQKRYAAFFILAGILNLTFVLQYFSLHEIGHLARSFFLIYYAVVFFKITQPSTVRTYNGVGLKIALTFLVLGYLLSGILPNYALSFLHLSYIGGFTLLTLMIATRVCLAHNGAGTDYELVPRLILPVVLIATISTIFRLLIFNNPTSHFTTASAVTFVFFCSYWIIVIALKKK